MVDMREHGRQMAPTTRRGQGFLGIVNDVAWPKMKSLVPLTCMLPDSWRAIRVQTHMHTRRCHATVLAAQLNKLV